MKGTDRKRGVLHNGCGMHNMESEYKERLGTVALTIFLVNRQSLSHGIENSQPLSISAQEQIMIFGQHKTEALFPASEF